LIFRHPVHPASGAADGDCAPINRLEFTIARTIVGATPVYQA
jgi:hypothetical protein